jgi:hypothetical protein
MRAITIFDLAVIVLSCLGAGFFPGLLSAQVISSVAITQDAHRMAIRVEGAGHLDVHAERIQNPERLALDFAGARLKVQRTLIPGVSAPVRGVRLGQFRPDVARVVIDLTSSVPYQITHEGDAVVVYLQVQPAETKASPAAASAVSEKEKQIVVVTMTPPTNNISTSNKDSEAETTNLPLSDELTYLSAASTVANAPVQLATVRGQDPAGASTNAAVPAWTPPPQDPTSTPKPEKSSVFRVKYISDTTLYLDAGHNAGLQDGMKLSVVEPPPDGFVSEGIRYRDYPHVAELNVVSVADTSAVCDVISTSGELKVGQIAFLTPGSFQDRHLAETAQETEDYPILVGFTSGDNPIDQDMRSSKVPNPLLESPVGVMRGRVGFSYGGIQESGMQSSQLSLMIDVDLTHIHGTYWDFAGFWRGYLNTSSSSIPGVGTQTLNNLINRTYTIGFRYQSPYSPNTVGIGRLYLPWAPSLSTIDGGYFGHRIGRVTTVGVFGGSTPNPASWSYNPNQKIAGTFVSFEDGDFDHVHFISTAGIAVTAYDWAVARQFAFFENNLNWGRHINLFSSLQIDNARTSPLPNGGTNPTGVSQTFNSVHFQPIKLVTFGVNYNYFRNLPTFDPRLIITGLLNQYLFTGLSGDVRLELPKHISLYASAGKSNASTDTRNSWNQAYGITFTNLFNAGIFLDAHYAKFDSSFGSGQYEALSISRNLKDNLHIQFLGGEQKFNSSLSTNTNSRFVTGTVDWTFSRRFFFEGTYGWYQGNTLNYMQWSTLLGYRFGGLRK